MESAATPNTCTPDRAVAYVGYTV